MKADTAIAKAIKALEVEQATDDASKENHAALKHLLAAKDWRGKRPATTVRKNAAKTDP